MSLDDLTMILIRTVLIVIFTVITKLLLPILKSVYDNMVNDKIKNIIKETVEATEQTVKGSGLGTLKKKRVEDLVNEFMSKHGYKMDEKLLNTLIEAAVFTMNSNKEGNS